jgi:uncharacterized protein
MLCPICNKAAAENNDPIAPNHWFPFCSERCKLIDLGRWLDGKYQIPVKPTEEAADVPPPIAGEDD